MEQWREDLYLAHHGIKGMKWGVRRYQNTDGSLTPEGKKRYSKDNRQYLARKLADNQFDVDNQRKSNYDEYEKRIKKLKEPQKWYDENGRLTKEARKYSDAYDKIHDEYSKKESSLYKARNEEIDKIRKKVFLSDDIKPKMTRAVNINKELDDLYDNTVDYKSEAYKKAYKQYVKDHGEEDAEYGFDHYYWPNSSEREKALKDYENKSSKLKQEYDELVKDVGKTITAGFGDQKMYENDWFDTYEEWGRNEVDEIVRFNRLNL